MKYPQVLVYESDGRLAGRLRAFCEAHSWALREPRKLESCLRLLRDGGPAVLLIKLGTDLVNELTLLERVRWLCPDVKTVVLGDSGHDQLADLSWDLGTHVVLLPQFAGCSLEDVLKSLLSVPEVPTTGAGRAD